MKKNSDGKKISEVHDKNGCTYDVERVRKDFPVLNRTVHGKPLVYLDSASTSQTPRSVVEKMADFSLRYKAAPHRGVHCLSEDTTREYEAARERLARFVNAPETSCVVFTRNCTEAINLVAYSWARHTLGEGDELLATELEHHSNLVPWQIVAEECGAILRLIPLTGDGRLDMEKLPELICEKTRLVCVTGMSNVLGTLVDIPSVVEAAHAVGALVLVDAAQLASHRPVDFTGLDIDFLALSGHKMLGPMGMGALVARREILTEEMEPFITGGGTVLDVPIVNETQWTEVPWKFEGGTPAVPGAIGFAEAINYLETLGMQAVADYEHFLLGNLLDGLNGLKGIVIYGPEEDCHSGGRGAATVSFNLTDGCGGYINPHDVGIYLDSLGIAIRAGHLCATPLMRHFGVKAMCRASLYLYNTASEVKKLTEALYSARKHLL